MSRIFRSCIFDRPAFSCLAFSVAPYEHYLRRSTLLQVSCTQENPRVLRKMFSEIDVRRKSIVTLALSGQLATADTYLLVSRINAFFDVCSVLVIFSVI